MMPAQFLEKIEEVRVVLDDDEKRQVEEDVIIKEFLEALVEQHKLQGVYNIVAKHLLDMLKESRLS